MSFLISLLLAASTIQPVEVCTPGTSPAQCASLTDGGLTVWVLNPGSGGGGGGGSVTQGTVPWIIQGWAFVDGGFVQVTQGTSPWTVNGTVAATQSGNWTVYANNDGGITVFQGTTPWAVTGTVQATQSGNWTVYANNDGGITVFQGTSPWVDSVTGSVSVTNFPSTQTVSGTVTATQGTTPWGDNVTQVGGAPVALGQTNMANSIPVTLPFDQKTVPVQIQVIQQPLNPLLPRCNAVRRALCQP